MNLTQFRGSGRAKGSGHALVIGLCLSAACNPTQPSSSRPRTDGSSSGVVRDTEGPPMGSVADAGSEAGTVNPSPSPPTSDAAPTTPDVQLQDVRGAQDTGGKPDGPAMTDTAPPSGSGNKPAAVPSAGCTAAAQLPEGMGTLPGGRKYIVHLPTGYDKSKPFPLVFANHPNAGNIGMFGDQKTRSVMKDWAILVLTESETGDWRQAFPADLAYFDALVPLVKDKLCVDTGRIYSFGFSGGASFSNLLACKRDFLRAVGGGGGIPGYNGYTAADCKPMPAWIDQGDRVGLIELWRAKNGCAAQAMPANRANCETYTCSGPPVVYCTNGNHSWPSYGSEDVAAFFKQF
ncbi:MAG TPA: hypothetical protein VGG33_27570 [Polyangia bacterium]